jgi:hypothetical protein
LASLVVRHVGDGLVQRGLQRTRIDIKKEVVLLDVVALLKMGVHQFAGDLGFHRNGGVSLHVSDHLHLDGNVLGSRHCHRDRHVAAATFLAAFGAWSGPV